MINMGLSICLFTSLGANGPEKWEMGMGKGEKGKIPIKILVWGTKYQQSHEFGRSVTESSTVSPHSQDLAPTV